MIRMSAIWDRTQAVLAGRTGILATIALLTIALPSIVQAAVAGAAPNAGFARSIIGIIVFALTLWGTLSITAVASDPARGQADGLAVGARAMLRAFGVMVVLGIVATVLLMPGILLLVGSGVDLAAAQRGDQAAAMANARLGPAMLYLTVLLVVFLWVAARLALIYPVLVNEPVALGAIRRAFALTRGLAGRIVGVLILYLIVLSVALLAAQMVFGTVLRLVLGAEQATTAAILTAGVLALVIALFSVIQIVFAAQLYVAAREEPEPVARSGPWA
jgi:hypothetical protein